MQVRCFSLVFIAVFYTCSSYGFLKEYKKLINTPGVVAKYAKPCRKFYNDKIDSLSCFQSKVRSKSLEKRRALELILLKDFYSKTDRDKDLLQIKKTFEVSNYNNNDVSEVSSFCKRYIQLYSITYPMCFVSVLPK